MPTTIRGWETVEVDELSVKRFLRAVAGGDVAAVSDVVTPDCVVHRMGTDADHVGPAEIATVGGDRALADVAVEVTESVVGEGRVATYATVSGRAVASGSPDGARTAGDEVTLVTFGIYRVEDGRIAEAWLNVDPVEGGAATDASLVERVGAWLRAD